MQTPSNAAITLLTRCLARCSAQEFGRRFQGAVAAALHRIEGYRGCYANLGAGQPDIFVNGVGFEVKSSAGGNCPLDDQNYLEVRGQFTRFFLVGMRTDMQPLSIWVLNIPRNFVGAVQLTSVGNAETPSDPELESALAAQLSVVLEEAGTRWSDAADQGEAWEAIKPELS